MPSLPLPPVPQRLREMLAEYPGHIERLQEALNTVVEKPSKATPPFEVAIWVLESRLGTFITEARDQLKAAEASGDAEAISRAKQAELLMSKARSVNGGMSDLGELWPSSSNGRGADMGDQESRLSELEHARILEEKVLAEADLASKTSLEHPKVIILAGQPGAGKGGLTQAARFELKNDVIVIDAVRIQSQYFLADTNNLVYA